MHEARRRRQYLFAVTNQLCKDSNRIKSTISLLMCNSHYIMPASSYDSIYVYVSANIKMHKSNISQTMKHLQHLHRLHPLPFHLGVTLLRVLGVCVCDMNKNSTENLK